ncbi:MAG TPA: hypothetical protein VJ978_14585 [Nitriliruptoraceae bacterium]|nr:hypothetical protein [Nitriliruptoraceae bacterium]
MATVTFTRRGDKKIGALSKIHVSVDGTSVGKLRNGHTAEADLAPGEHTVEATLMGSGDLTTTIDVPEEGAAYNVGFETVTFSDVRGGAKPAVELWPA